MGLKIIIPVLTLLALAACGTTEEKTVVVNPPPGGTVVVPANGAPQVVTPEGH